MSPKRRDAGGGRIRWLLALLVVTAVGLTVGGVRMRDFVRRDPQFCALCHQKRVEPLLWSAGAHQSIVCQDCHHTSERDALRTLIHVVDGSANERLHRAPANADACATCHQHHDEGWARVSASPGHELHARSKVTCKDCHAAGIHQYAIPLDTCEHCHKKQTVRASGMERVHCTSCHNFMTPDRSLKPDREMCLHCHDSRVKLNTTFPDNAPMATLACKACHRPHVDAKASYVECASCHEKEADHGLHRVKEHQVCKDCHRAHGWVSERGQCLDCHKDMTRHHGTRECRQCHEFTAARSQGSSKPAQEAP